jgi:hypothetical protein
MADNTPDFDSMSPEEIMAWMESLAKRQGASSEQFTTAADMEIAEIDPDTVIIDEPGYVPYGEEAPKKTETAPPPAAVAPPQPALQRVPQPVPLTPPPVSIAAPQPVPLAPPPEREPDIAEMQPVARTDELETVVQPKVDEGSLAWLESLAADQGDNLFNLDLSSLSEEVEPEPASAAIDPVSWLEELARTQGELDTPLPQQETLPGGGDSITWLESLARRQGANPEELTTEADLDIPVPEADVEEPAYTPFSFDTPTIHRSQPATPEPLKLEDPAAFLDSLAAEQGYSEEGVRATQPQAEAAPEPDMSIEDIQRAIDAGTVTPEQMQVFLEHQTDIAAQQPEEPLLEDYDPDAPPVPAELPDWLLEQVGPPPTFTEEAKAPTPEQPALVDVIAQPPPVDEMPDWLKADISSPEVMDLESIFAQTDEEAPMPMSVITPEPDVEVEIVVDPNDPWVEAFDIEHEQGAVNIDTVPEWYERNLSDPERIAAVEKLAHHEGSEVEIVAATNGLSDEPLPAELDLSPGTPQGLPGWVPAAPSAPESAEVIEVEPAIAEIPDWLREVEAEVSPEEIPDWLKETIAPEEEAIFAPVAPPEPVAQVAAPPPVRPAPSPASVPTPAFTGTATLESARAKNQRGDLDSCLVEYEALVRGSAHLEAVVEDLSQLVKAHKNNPAVYRVLGDGLMRQGKLQAALDTYREALNQL